MAKASLDFPGSGSSLNTAEMRVEEVQEPRDSRKFLCRDKRREQTNQQECKDGEFAQVLHSLPRDKQAHLKIKPFSKQLNIYKSRNF